jgi:hypothetical protein
VNFATCYYTPDVPYPQGGRLWGFRGKANGIPG